VRALGWFFVLLAASSGACSDDEPNPKPATGGDAGSDAGGAAGSGGAGAGSDASPEASAGKAGNAGAGAQPSNAISISTSSLLETETNVAAAADGRVAVTWIGITGSSTTHIGVAFSADDGASWKAPQKIESPDGRVSSDPVVAAGPDSSIYLTWIGFRRDASGNPIDMRVYAAKAAAGELAFGPIIEVTGPVASDSVDKPWIAVDKNGVVYITWLDTGEPRMRIGVSENGAQSFAIHDIDDGQGFRNLIYPCIDEQTGRLYVVYHPGGGIGLRFSDDQGKTWPQATAVALPTDPDAMFDDPTCAAHGGKVWIAYGVGTDTFDKTTNPRSNRLRVALSTDGGASIAQRTFAEDPATGTKFLHPQLARDTSGTLWLVYYAGSESDPDPAGTLRLSSSTDEGASWSPSTIVKQPITFLSARNNAQWLGDYIGLFALGSRLYISYADNTTGFSHVHFFAQ
jgi:hypothetical protein